MAYWSGTGNTQAMAEAVLEGAKAGGAEVDLFTVSEFDALKVEDYDAVSFGCPAMGAETLEEGEFQPMFDSVEGYLDGKKTGLFGSYGWGDGEWMQAGRKHAGRPAQFLCATALSAMKRQMMKLLRAARRLEGLWRNHSTRLLEFLHKTG